MLGVRSEAATEAEMSASYKAEIRCNLARTNRQREGMSRFQQDLLVGVEVRFVVGNTGVRACISRGARRA